MIAKPDRNLLETVVVDANVIVSGMIFPQSAAQRASREAFARFTVIGSEASLSELQDVVHREKFDRYVPLSTRIEILRAYLISIKEVPSSSEYPHVAIPRTTKSSNSRSMGTQTSS